MHEYTPRMQQGQFIKAFFSLPLSLTRPPTFKIHGASWPFCSSLETSAHLSRHERLSMQCTLETPRENSVLEKSQKQKGFSLHTSNFVYYSFFLSMRHDLTFMDCTPSTHQQVAFLLFAAHYHDHCHPWESITPHENIYILPGTLLTPGNKKDIAHWSFPFLPKQHSGWPPDIISGWSGWLENSN